MLNNRILMGTVKCLGGHFMNCVKSRSASMVLLRNQPSAWWRLSSGSGRAPTSTLTPWSLFGVHEEQNGQQFRCLRPRPWQCTTSSTRWSGKKREKVTFSTLAASLRRKGIGTLIKVCKELPDVQFIFAGTGPLEETVNGIKNIKNVGFRKARHWKSSSVRHGFSIYPSEWWYENCPFSVMESQMYGTPVLGATLGVSRNWFRSARPASCLRAVTGKIWRRKIEKLWGDKKLCEQYSKNCKDISFDTIDSITRKLWRCISKRGGQ